MFEFYTTHTTHLSPLSTRIAPRPAQSTRPTRHASHTHTHHKHHTDTQTHRHKHTHTDHIHTHIHTHIHAYIHAYIYAYINVKVNRPRVDVSEHAQTFPASDRHPQVICHRLQASRAQKEIQTQTMFGFTAYVLCAFVVWGQNIYIYIYIYIEREMFICLFAATWSIVRNSILVRSSIFRRCIN